MPHEDAILVVGESPELRSACQQALGTIGVRVEAVQDVAAARRALARRRFPVVVTERHCGEIRCGGRGADILLTGGVGSFSLFEPEVRALFERRRAERLAALNLQLRAELQAAYGELHKVERLKTALAARVSHELRTPLTIAMLAAALLRQDVSGTGVPALRRLEGALERLRQRVEDLLLFAHGRARALAREPVDMTKAAAAAARQWWSAAHAKQLALFVSTSDGDLTAAADRALVEIALGHLIGNAVKFSRPGGVIRVRLERNGDVVTVRVRDCGPGIELAESERVFDSFYQVAEHMTREAGGLGLGLALVRTIAEAHGGRVEIQESGPAGTTFKLSLPGGGA